MRFLLLIALVLAICGCGKEDRARAASEEATRLQAIQILAAKIRNDLMPLAQAEPAAVAIASALKACAGVSFLAHTAEQSLPAVADVTWSEFPATATSATTLAENPELDRPSVSPKGGLNWVEAGSILLGVVGLGLRFGKNLPGVAGVASTIALQVYNHFAPQKILAKEQATEAVVAELSPHLPAVLTVLKGDSRLAHLAEKVQNAVVVLTPPPKAPPA